jgi:hypothetical protein
MAKSNAQHKYFQVDWVDFRKDLRSTILENKSPAFSLNHNRTIWREIVTDSGSWRGFTSGQLHDWISDGYIPPAMIHGVDSLIPPMVEERKTIWTDDGDEFHADLAISGDENFMSEKPPVPTLFGLNVEAGIMFASMIDAKTVNAYTVWLAKVLFSLESAGIDAQLTLDFSSWNSIDDRTHRGAGTGTLYHTLVRVKQENETADFKSWSAMVSPAALRNFGFGAITLHADNLKLPVSYTMGRGMPDRTEWKVIWNAERRVLEIQNAYMHSAFNEDRMTESLKAALREMDPRLG